jgi:hypothetical protein
MYHAIPSASQLAGWLTSSPPFDVQTLQGLFPVEKKQQKQPNLWLPHCAGIEC